MAGSTHGDRVHGSRFTAYLRRKFKKDDRTRDSAASLPKAEASLARNTASLIPPATSQEANAAINAVDATTSTTSIGATTSTSATISTGATASTNKPVESQADIIEESVKSDLWSRAYQKLDGEAKKWTGDTAQNGGGEGRTQDLIKIVREREEEYKDGTPKLRVGDKEILWRDYANGVVAWVTAIGDISISFAPAPSTVIWSALKVLLKVRI